MYRLPLAFSIKSNDSLLKIHFNKINTDCQIKLENDSGVSMLFSRDELKKGVKNFIMDTNSKVDFKVTGATQLIHFGNRDY